MTKINPIKVKHNFFWQLTLHKEFMTGVGCEETAIKGKHMVSFSISFIFVLECNFYLVI